jgi:APA family basic amino acid/polyamine antiporter
MTPSSSFHLQGAALWSALAAALQGAFWAYDGWNDVTYVAGEVKNPRRNLPRGILSGMIIVVAIYLTVNLAYAYILPIDRMAASKLVAVDVVDRLFSGGGRWIALAIAISTFGAANSNVLGAARIYFSMARRKVFPAFLGRAHPRFYTPAGSLGIQAVWSTLLLLSGTYDTITDTLIFIAWIFYGAGAFGIFVLRRREPDAPRPFRAPGYPWLPSIFVLFTLVFLALTLYHDIANYHAAKEEGKPAAINAALGAFLVLLGAPIYWFYRRKGPDIDRHNLSGS